MKKNILNSFIVNIVGLVSLFMIDMTIAKSSDTELIASWALTKSVLFIGVLFVLLGLDQAIVRMKLKLQDILFPAIIQFTFMILLIIGLLYLFDFKLDIFTLSISMFMLAISYLLYASYRLDMHYIKSQIFLQSWKLILLVGLVLFGYHSYSLLLPISLSMGLLFFAYHDIIKLKPVQFSIYRDSLTTGLHYFVSLATLTISLYFDQLLLNYDSKTVESSQLFSHITFFVSPIAIFLGFAGFIIGPYLRNNPDKKVSFFKKVIVIYIFIGVFLSFCSYLLGRELFFYFKQDYVIVDYLSLSLVAVVFLRYLYILPSAYIGSFASNLLIREVSLINLVGLLLYIVNYFILSRFFGDYLVAIVSSMLLVWLIRIVNGYYAVYKILIKEDSYGT